jgi:hypothetical protein
VRIFDRIAGGESVFGKLALREEIDEQIDQTGALSNTRIRKYVHHAMRVVCDDAASYVQVNPRKKFDIENGDFGPLRPQHNLIWFEWKSKVAIWTSSGISLADVFNVACIADSVVGVDGQTDTILWLIAPDGDGDLAVVPYAMRLLIDNDGRIVNKASVRDMAHLASLAVDLEVDPDEFDVLIQIYEALFDVPLLAIGWMNCKNLTLEDVKIPEHTQRRRRKNRQPIGLDYRQIKVMPDKRKKSGTTSSHEDPQPQPLHMVRGHFKTFTAEKPLLGRIVGTFWWSHQLRGVEEMGRINHEYHTTAMGKQ